MNTQIPVSKSDNSSTDLRVIEIFNTIQGEAIHAGRPAVFIRLAGCNLQCPHCDTEYTQGAITWRALDLLSVVIESSGNTNLVVITGGEPLLQNIAPLIKMLIKHNYRVQIETNGSVYRDDIPYHAIDIVCSPKTHKLHKKIIEHIDAYKYVVAHDNFDLISGLPTTVLGNTKHPKGVARPVARQSGYTPPVYIQPMDSKDEAENIKNTRCAIQSCLEHNYRLCLQIHKIVGLS